MVKLNIHFQVTIPFPKLSVTDGKMVTRHLCNLTFSGVGYYYPAEPLSNQYDYDLDQVFCDVRGFDMEIPLEALEAFGIEHKMDKNITGPILSHVRDLFQQEATNEYLAIKKAEEMMSEEENVAA